MTRRVLPRVLLGTAISIVEIIIGTRSQPAIPATNMWCAHTEKPSTRMPISDIAIRRYPKIGFRAITEKTSEMIPNPGRIMM